MLTRERVTAVLEEAAASVPCGPGHPIWLLLKDLGSWRLARSQDGRAFAQEDSPEPGSPTLSLDGPTLLELAAGDLSPLKAFTSGRVSVSSLDRKGVTEWLPVIKQAGVVLLGPAGLDSLEVRVANFTTGPVDLYTVLVTVNGAASYPIRRRYSDFRRFHNSLGAASPAGFPPKSLWVTDAVRLARVQSLHAWLQKCASTHKPQLARFLDASSATPVSPQAVPVSTEEKRHMKGRQREVEYDSSALSGKMELVQTLQQLQSQQSEHNGHLWRQLMILAAARWIVWLACCWPAAGAMGTLSGGVWLLLSILFLTQQPLFITSLLVTSAACWQEGPGWHALWVLAETLALVLPCQLALQRLDARLYLWRSLKAFSLAGCFIGCYVAVQLALRLFRVPQCERDRVYHCMDQLLAPLAANMVQGLKGLFVKVGQNFGARTDVVTPEWRKALRVLHDKMPSDPVACVEQTVCESFGAYAASVHLEDREGMSVLQQVFSEFDMDPIASASIAQVHVASLRETGQRVAVKVRHHDIAALLEVDIILIGRILATVVWLNPSFKPLESLFEDVQPFIRKELDLELEATNLSLMRELLVVDAGANVVIPKVIHGLVSPQSFCMEFIEHSFRVDNSLMMDYCEVDKQAFAEQVFHAWACMICQLGKIHVDPHPGNVLVQLTPEGAKPVLLDWGFVSELESDVVAGFRSLFQGLEKMDNEGIQLALQQIGFTTSQDAFAPERRGEFFAFLLRETGDARSAKKGEESFRKLRKKQREEDEAEGNRTKMIPTAFPISVVVVFRVVGMLRGMCATLGAQLSIIEIFAQHCHDSEHSGRSSS